MERCVRRSKLTSEVPGPLGVRDRRSSRRDDAHQIGWNAASLAVARALRADTTVWSGAACRFVRAAGR